MKNAALNFFDPIWHYNCIWTKMIAFYSNYLAKNSIETKN